MRVIIGEDEVLPPAARARPRARPAPHPRGAAPVTVTFPPGFLWGAATAAHQIEGNNINHVGHVGPRTYDRRGTNPAW